jgi:hypothetical protein
MLRALASERVAEALALNTERADVEAVPAVVGA